MQVQCTRFREVETLEVPEQAVLSFPEGIPAFEQHTSFALVADPAHRPFRWLQSLVDPDVGFVVLEPRHVAPSYLPAFADQDLSCLNLEEGTPPNILGVLVVIHGPQDITVNLKAPLVMNPTERICKQVILADERYPLRVPVNLGRLGADGGDPCSY